MSKFSLSKSSTLITVTLGFATVSALQLNLTSEEEPQFWNPPHSTQTDTVTGYPSSVASANVTVASSSTQMPAAEVDADDRKCHICFDDDADLINFEGAWCNHKWCKDCAARHIVEGGNKKCPMCRQPFKAIAHDWKYRLERGRATKRRQERRAEEEEVYSVNPLYSEIDKSTTISTQRKAKTPNSVVYAFENNEQLNHAIRAYVEPNEASQKNVKAHYGENINDWDVSLVEDFSYLFQRNGDHDFNEPLNDWNVSAATNMDAMFANCYEFNQPLDKWDTSNVESMFGMFWGCNNFNQDLSNFKTGKVTNMTSMFSWNYEFNNGGSPGINNWDTSKVTGMREVFNKCPVFNQPIGDWDVSKVTDMHLMFCDAETFNQPLQKWDVQSCTIMGGMFRGASAFNQPLKTMAKNQSKQALLQESDTQNLSMRKKALKLLGMDWNKLGKSESEGKESKSEIVPRYDVNIGKYWDTRNLLDMECMFCDAKSFDQDLSSWDVSSVTSMVRTFKDAKKFNNGGKPLTWKTSTELRGTTFMFYRAQSFKGDGVDSWDISGVTGMQFMFSHATSFDKTLESWQPKKLTNANYMFYKTPNFDLTTMMNWNPRLFQHGQGMFLEAGKDAKTLERFKNQQLGNLKFQFYQMVHEPMKDNKLEHPSWESLFIADTEPTEEELTRDPDAKYNPPWDTNDYDDPYRQATQYSEDFVTQRAAVLGLDAPDFDADFVRTSYVNQDLNPGDDYDFQTVDSDQSP